MHRTVEPHVTSESSVALRTVHDPIRQRYGRQLVGRRAVGGLRLTREGLRLRDRLVMDTVSAAGIPLVITLAGGYARKVEDTVAIHVATIEEATKNN